MNSKEVLPVDGFIPEIVQTVKDNRVTILVAETGAGKSTRVPLAVMLGLGRPVIVTQPRILAAKSVAARAAEENGLQLGGVVGYRTSKISEDTPETLCLYCTDGLHLVRELTEAKRSLKKGIVLILDEVHEFNENIETLLAWSDQLIKEGVDVKIVIMSATLEHESLAQYFGGAPVIHIPGRTFPVVGAPTATGSPCQKPAESVLSEITEAVRAQKNTLVFLPGKSEISEMRHQLQEAALNAELLELHGDLTSEEQELVFKKYFRPKVILSTNVAQTSVTITDIDHVVDLGLGKRIELWNGVETLTKRPISKSDVQQRAGRAGRTKPGSYVLCSDTPYEQYPDFPIPEILQKRTDQLVLRLATAGFDATELRFFHQPDGAVLTESKQVLIDMEALHEDGTVTDLGYQINRFPTSIVVARMIIEAIKRKCLTRILTFAAILSNGRGSIKLTQNKYRTDPPDYKWWYQVIPADKQYRSDLLVEFDLWDLAFKNYTKLGQHGVDRRSYLQAVDIRQELKRIVRAIGYHAGPEYNVNADNEAEVLKCVTAGMIHQVHRYVGGNKYLGDETRTLSRDSVITRGGAPTLIVGIPQNIPVNNTRGEGSTKMVIPILASCTAIETDWLKELAPNLLRVTAQPVSWNYEVLMLTADTVTRFNKREISRVRVSAEYSPEHAVLLGDALSHVFFPEGGDPVTDWVERIRTSYTENKLGNNFQFARIMTDVAQKYETVSLIALRAHEAEITKMVLGQPPQKKGKKKAKAKTLTLPLVVSGNYVSALYQLPCAQPSDLSFTFEQKSEQGRMWFRVTGYLKLGEYSNTVLGEWFSSKSEAKQQTAQVMYKRLSDNVASTGFIPGRLTLTI